MLKKKTISLLGSILLSLLAMSQTFVDRSSSAVTAQDARLSAKLNFYMPRLCDTTNGLQGGKDTIGAIFYDKCNLKVWVRDTIITGGHKWTMMFKADQSAANNGLSVSGSRVQLGQTPGTSGNPAALIDSREIPMSDSTVTFKNGTFTVLADHRINGAAPPFKVTSTSTLFQEVAEFKAHYVTEVWLRSDSSDGFTGIGFALNGSQKFGLGTDGNADHNYLQTHGFPLWIENDASSAFAAFEDDGDISLVVNDTGRNLGIGVTVPLYRVDINNAKTGITYSDRILNLNDAGTTYNTSGGALTNSLAYLQSTASKSAGGNTLTNQALYIRAAGGDVNHGIFIDTPSTFIAGRFTNTSAWASFDHAQIVNNTSSTQKYNELQVTRSMQYNDSVGGIEGNGASTITADATYRFKVSGTIQDNLSGGPLKCNWFFRRSILGYTGAQTVTGFPFPTNNVTTMPSVINARFDASQIQSGGNSIRFNGFFAGITSFIATNPGNSLGKFAWINAGAAQTGGTIDTGYVIYIQDLNGVTTTKYSIYQAGSSDTNYLAGITKTFNFQADKTITAGGTTGDQTINKISGTVNFAALATTLTVTNSFVTANSNVFCTIRTNDATATIKNVVPTGGSFTITLTAGATAETSVGFFVVN